MHIREWSLKVPNWEMIINGLQSEIELIMNKKEIAKSFTRQILDQNQEMPNYDQTLKLLMELEEFHTKVRQDNLQQLYNMKIMEYTFQALQKKTEHLAKQLEILNHQITATTTNFKKNQKISIWYRYWTALGVGIISSVITNLIWVVMS